MGQSARQATVFPTARGFCGIVWTATGVARFQLPLSTEAGAERAVRRFAPDAQPAEPPPAIAAVIEAARRYFDGEAIDFTAIALDLDGQDGFFRQIYDGLRQIPYGQTTTYGALAKQLGAGPEAARDVGQAMARNPVPLIIPCHRVLAAGNRIGGFSAPGGAETKRHMLALEGVSLDPPPPAQAALNLFA